MSDIDGFWIELVDAPDKSEGDFGLPQREGQRTYKIAVYSAAGHRSEPETIRVRFDPDADYGYIVENLVGPIHGKKWHKLLQGYTTDRVVPFDEAVLRAAKVLL